MNNKQRKRARFRKLDKRFKKGGISISLLVTTEIWLGVNANVKIKYKNNIVQKKLSFVKKRDL